MKVVIDHDLCIGDGICEAISAEIFELRDDGLAYVLDGSSLEDLLDAAKEAAEACPVTAITVED